jgi:hypothetical protein
MEIGCGIGVERKEPFKELKLSDERNLFQKARVWIGRK